jgi:ABC-type branched-subunit amino acid transport system substrate-binding protein
MLLMLEKWAGCRRETPMQRAYLRFFKLLQCIRSGTVFAWISGIQSFPGSPAMAFAMQKWSRLFLSVLGAASLSLAVVPAKAEETVKLGLVAAMSGQSAKSDEAIVRGLSLAIDEINAKGGLLGKKVELLVRDDESNPAKGVIAARELVQRERVAAFFGGLARY